MGLPPVSFPTLGWVVCEWIEEYLCHGPGDVQGQSWTPDVPGLGLDDEEVLFVCWAYRVWPRGHELAGRRLVHRAVYSRPKGRRKSEIAGALMCAEALGPVRCDGFDSRGDPVGAPVTYPFVRCLATEEEQAGNTFDNVTYMLTHGAVANEYAVDIGRSAETSTRVIIREPGGGEIIPSTAGAESKDGGKETAATADETHLMVLPKLRAMYRTVARNTGKRKIADPWMLDTTTMYRAGENSVAEQAAAKYAHLPVEECVIKRGVLYDHREGAEPKVFGDDRSLMKAMRAGYGPAAEWTDFHKCVRIIRDAEDPEEEAYRYYLNIERKSGNVWLSPSEVAAAIDVFDVPEGSAVALGFDGSENDDHTVLMGCTESGDLVTVGAWVPEGESFEWRLEVDEAVAWAHEVFDVVRFYGDPAYWVSEMARWASEHGDHVREFWTGGRSEAKMAFATGTLKTALGHGTKVNPVPLRTDEIRRAGKSLVRWHLENARTRRIRVKVDESTRAEDMYLLRKERKGSPLKIDAATSSVLARAARDHALKDGEFSSRRRVFARAAWQ